MRPAESRRDEPRRSTMILALIMVIELAIIVGLLGAMLTILGSGQANMNTAASAGAAFVATLGLGVTILRFVLRH